MKDLSKNIKFLEVPILVLLALIVVSLVGAKIIFDRFSIINNESADLKSTQELLTQKLTVLQTNNQKAADFSSKVNEALPSRNPSFIVLAQLRNMTSQVSALISDVSVGQGVKDQGTNISYVPITFKTSGDPIKLSNILLQVNKFAPISKLQELKLVAGTGANDFVATITLNTYWSELPTKIPAISEPITQLTPDENKILQDVSNLQSVAVGSSQPTSAVAGSSRTNPFSP